MLYRAILLACLTTVPVLGQDFVPMSVEQQVLASKDSTSATLARLLRQPMGQVDQETQRALLERLEKSVKTPQDMEIFADALIFRKEYARAIATLTPLVAAHPNEYRLRGLLAVALEEEGRYESAFEHYLALLEMTEEIPAQVMPTPYYYEFSPVRDPRTCASLPEEAKLLLRFCAYRSCIYSFRGPCFSPSGADDFGLGRTDYIPLPTTIRDVPMWSAVHLAVVSQKLDLIDDASRLTRRNQVLANCGLTALIPFMDVPVGPHENVNSLARITGSQKPLDPNVIALSLSAFPEIGPQMLTPEQLNVTLSTYGKSNSLLAMSALLQTGLARNDKNLIDQAAKILEGMQPYRSQVAEDLLQWLEIPSCHLSEEFNVFRASILAKLLSWYPQIAQERRGWDFTVFLEYFSQNQDLQGWLRCAEDRFAARTPSARVFRIDRPRWDRDFRPISIPAETGTTIPREILKSLGIYDEKDRRWSAEQIRSLVAQTKSPILRILFAHAINDLETVDRELVAALTMQPQDEDLLLFAASRRASKGDYLGASQTLVQLRALLPKHISWPLVDQALVFAAMQVQNADALHAGRQAYLRLWKDLERDFVSDSYPILQKLGLVKEAAQEKERQLSYEEKSLCQVEQILKDGKRTEAIEILAKHIRAEGADWVASYHPGSVLQRMESGFAITKDLAVIFAPKPDATARDHALYGRILEWMGNLPAAQKAYQTALLKNPVEPNVALRLLKIGVEIDPEHLVDWVKMVPLHQLGEVSGISLQNYSSDEINIPLPEEPGIYNPTLRLKDARTVLGVSAAIVAVLERMPNLEEQSLWWVQEQITVLAEKLLVEIPGSPKTEKITLNRIGKGKLEDRLIGKYHILENLYERTKKGVTVSDPLLARIAQRQRELHDRLCQILLRHPNQGHGAFGRLQLLVEAEKRSDEDLAHFALQVLSVPPRPGYFFGEPGDFMKRDKYIEVSIDIFGLSPLSEAFRYRRNFAEEFLPFAAYKRHDRAWLEQQILPFSADERLRGQRQNLKNLADLYFCPELAFWTPSRRASRRTLPQPPSVPPNVATVATTTGVTLPSNSIPMIPP